MKRPNITARSRRSPHRTTGGTGTRRTWTLASAAALRRRPPRPLVATWRRSSTLSSRLLDARTARCMRRFPASPIAWRWTVFDRARARGARPGARRRNSERSPDKLSRCRLLGATIQPKSEGRWTNGFPLVDDVAGHSRRRAEIGAVPHGTRVTAPIASGHFEGPRLRGKVLPNGGDWTLLRGDGVLELDLRLTLETDDGALIHMTSFGLRHGPPEVIAAPRARRERRPLDLLLPDHAPLRDRSPEVRVLESPPRRIERRSARRRPDLHDSRDPMRPRGRST